MNVRFCPSCRSLILEDFRYCPYCGQAVAVRGPGLSEALDGAFADLGAGASPHSDPRGDVFASAEANLERLEAEMDLLLEAMEKEGRSAK